MKIHKNIFTSFLALIVLIAATPSYAEIKIGVLAPRGQLKSMKRWKDFSHYMTNKLGDKVQMVPLAPPEIVPAVEADTIDLVLTNPVHTAIISELYDGKLLATLNKKSGPVFAGVIVARKDSGINSAEDLKGKRVMSLKFKVAAGAYTFQTYHLHEKGIDPHKDFASMRAGKKQDDLVLAVKAGVIDAAFVRSGILESMEAEGKINMEEFTVVDQRTDDRLNLAHTTKLYPEWYLTALSKTDSVISDKAEQAVLKLNADDPAAQTAKIKGFVAPVPLDGMVTALRALKISPFNN